jgi:C4-type Zn-finger protein
MAKSCKGQECPDCGGALREAVEITASAPWGTGFMIWVCDTCGKRVGDSRFVGF